MNKLLDLADRAGWTFAQAAIGSLVGVNLVAGSVNWQEVLVTAGVAGAVAALKALGVNAAQVNQAKAVVQAVESVPAVATEVAKVEATPVVKTTEEVAEQVAAELMK